MSEHHETSLVAAFVLGSLEADAREVFTTHLAGCPECQQEVRSLQRVTHALAASAPSRTPSLALRSRVLSHALGRSESEGYGTGRATGSRRGVDVRTWLPLAA